MTRQFFYELRKHFKDSDGLTDYETILKTDTLETCERERAKYPKDNKKIQYTCKGYFKTTITKSEAREYEKIHAKIWADKISGKSQF